MSNRQHLISGNSARQRSLHLDDFSDLGLRHGNAETLSSPRKKNRLSSMMQRIPGLRNKGQSTASEDSTTHPIIEEEITTRNKMFSPRGRGEDLFKLFFYAVVPSTNTTQGAKEEKNLHKHETQNSRRNPSSPSP